ncbi:MAG: hypothetical protein ACO3GR_04485 [Candidatus Kapaibacteriota bacterium]|jgi:hypothetical protein
MKYLSSIVVLVAIFMATPIFAQDPPPDCNATEAQMKAKQYTKEQGDNCIKEWEQKVKELQERLNALNTSIGSLNKNLTDANASLQSSNDEIAQLLNATQRQIEEFGQRLGVLEGKTRAMKGMNDAQLAEKYEDVKALENELNKMRGEKIALYPSYFNRIIDLARDIRSLYRTKPTKDYVVGTWADDRDCLWNIAGKAEIYNDALLWPKVWQANTEIIRNPDVIFPGQRLTLPAAAPKTTDEMKAERTYWKKKRAAAVAAQKAVEQTTPQSTGTVK